MATGIVPPFAGWPRSGSSTIAALGQIMPAFADAYTLVFVASLQWGIRSTRAETVIPFPDPDSGGSEAQA
jgi:hypothetical protein